MNLKKKLTLSGAALMAAFSITGTIVAQASTDLTGWLHGNNGDYTYVTKGKTDSGKKYQQLPNIANPEDKSWYLTKDGIALDGVQDWTGPKWYFDPTTYLLVKNKDITVDGVSYHADKDGRITKNTNQETGFDPSEINWTTANTTFVVGDGWNSGDKFQRWVFRNMSGDHQDPYGYFESWGISED
ncbi:hypothetical protein [Limosilactobacillus equigenerosi]|uniref:Surface layer protein A domain-containing protein n=1 Tax=Limosilactobacillus equigenerosi DSM 18793 = JCM 14505 TaxID=1423742 RepID=A0A0R1UFU6_9LACO|nr:hypothetical protein [Limosilactobacillus equigenerosi]KRL92310.1 hypothetical protein FC21_GL000356 [Limosilactobacillus equigenerosi DSM 18793 = JCM 14505]